MNLSEWKSLINKICGYFWTTVFKDSWILSVISKFMYFCIANPVITGVFSIKNQIRASYIYKRAASYPLKFLLKEIPFNDSGLVTTEFAAGIDKQNLYMYSIQNRKEVPLLLMRSVATDTTQDILEKDVDYKVFEKQGKILSKVCLHDYKRLEFIKQDNFIECFELWGPVYDTTYILDTWSYLTQLPISWTYKYPGILSKAWEIKQKGMTKKLCEDLLLLMNLKDAFFIDMNTYKKSNITTVPFIKASGIQHIPIKINSQYNTLLKIFKHNYLILDITFTELTEDIQTLIHFIKTNLPLGTIFYAFTKNCLSNPSEGFSEPCDKFYIRQKRILQGNARHSQYLIKNDFDRINP